MNKALDKFSFSGLATPIAIKWIDPTGSSFSGLVEAGRCSLGEIESLTYFPDESLSGDSLLDRIPRTGINRPSSRVQTIYRSNTAPPYPDNKLKNKNRSRNSNNNDFGGLIAADAWRFSHDQS